jgi:hypothetical protein
MAFNIQAFGRVSGGGANEVYTLQDGTLVGSPQVLTYISSTDTLATIQAADYFADLAGQLNVSDKIYVVGSDGQNDLRVSAVTVGPTPSVTTVPGGSSGDVDGPASATDNAVARFDGTTGKLLQDSGVLIDDSDAMSGVTQLDVDNVQINGNTITTTDTDGDLNINADGNGNILCNGNDLICGDPGTEASGITVGGATYEAALKVSDLGGTNVAQFIIHRHSTTLAPMIVGARTNSNTSAHSIVVDAQPLFALYGVGWDGADYAIGAQMEIEVDGTPGAGDMPGRFVFSVSPEGAEVPVEAFRISQDRTSLVSGTLDIDHTAGAADDHALEIDVDAAGFGDVKAIDIVYITGAIAAGEDEGAILINVDESDSTGGDVNVLEVLATGEGSATIHGYTAGIGVAPVAQLSGSFGNMDSALVNAVDRLTEFTTPGSNVSIFVADNDTVTIGDAAKFQEIEFILATVASGSGIAPTFEYSTGVGTWASFTPVDGTNGMRNNGIIAWLDSDIPSWALGTGSEYLIRITRTRNTLSTVPVEDLVQIGTAVEYDWDKNGDLNTKSMDIDASQAYKVAGTAILSDSAGTMTLSNVDALDATTAATISANTSGKNRNVCIAGNADTNPWQRGTSFTGPSNGDFTADRFSFAFSGAGVVDVLKTADAPTAAEAGFYSANCFHVDVTTADASIAAGDFYMFRTKIEGYDWAALAQNSFTVSFWHKHTKTGTYCVALRNSGADRSWVTEYTQSVSDTWEKATISVDASPSGGTWSYTTGVGIEIDFTIAAGATYHIAADSWVSSSGLSTSNQVNGMDNAANNFKIGLVQVEAGDVATAFEFRSEQEVLSHCQRYYQVYSGGQVGLGLNTTGILVPTIYVVQMRATPTQALLDTSVTIEETGGQETSSGSTIISTAGSDNTYARTTIGGFASIVANAPTPVNNAADWIEFASEI